jgi:Tat protein secretion system quality control protein TatD with DNase activity
MVIWDLHAHAHTPVLDLESFFEQGGVVFGGIHPEDWALQRSYLPKNRQRVRVSVGLHPWWIEDSEEDELHQALEAFGDRMEQADLLGEVGLDAVRAKRERTTLEKQIRWVDLQVKKWREIGAPDRAWILHVVRAHELLLDVLPKDLRPPQKLQGLVHSFCGDLRQGRAWIDRGFLLSLNARAVLRAKEGDSKILALLRSLPPQSIGWESDSPDQASFDILEQALRWWAEYLGISYELALERQAQFVAELTHDSRDSTNAPSV